ncbi:MAG: FG-GAP-like repeat-containing protein [Lentisphaerota bacterium]
MNNYLYKIAMTILCFTSMFFVARADSVASAADWHTESNQAGALMGGTVASGDVNGDGYDDVIVPAQFYINGETNEGKVFLYYGSPTGISLTPGWSAEGNQINMKLGAAVAFAGDVNGDGYGDVLVATAIGKIFLYYGSASGLSASPVWTLNYGYSIACAGDVNKDGYDDVIIGDNNTANGTVYVFHGSPTGLSSTPNWTVNGEQVGSWFGHQVASAGDVNGDGYDDVITYARYYNNTYTSAGKVYVYHGSATGLSATPAWIKEGTADYDKLGWTVSSAGDINKDGYGDVAITTKPGKVYVYNGSASGLSASRSWSATMSSWPSTSFGDINKDGYSDLVVACCNYTGTAPKEGAVFIWYGASTGLGVDGTTANAHWKAVGGQGGDPS